VKWVVDRTPVVPARVVRTAAVACIEAAVGVVHTVAVACIAVAVGADIVVVAVVAVALNIVVAAVVAVALNIVVVVALVALVVSTVAVGTNRTSEVPYTPVLACFVRLELAAC